MIETIKIQGDGYLVNGTLSVPKADGNRHYEEVKLAIAGDNDKYPTAIVVEDEFTQGELDEQAQETINSESLAYLASTDWYVTRLLETDVVIPAEITTLRAEARLAIV